ncbi:ABC transporter ATP-binding protein [Kribbella sp. CA-293567]|uniref:ABC transporter ATP-binding protein n=1 Tax=Kribbella sp. CA-293567 TaxID=3002436 RepID=UPI0022DE1CBF|nr:ATP-binding cassette domain-containing protein [Kribbella sp. CA-293567]WBQ04994.1 ATP-binding cassette domain-containing protein [Kribbella sp. CA-293567]
MTTEFRVNNLVAGYGRAEILHDLTFAVSGAVIGLLGPNGAGKTTLLSVVTGARAATRGSITVGGSAVESARLGYLPQNLRPPGGYECRDFLRYVAWLRKVPSSVVDEQIGSALAAVGLENRAGKKIRTLSGGQQQRLGVAQALVNRPSLLVLDEPTVGLDPEQRRQFLDLIARLGTEHTVLMATHITDDVASTCDQVVVIDAGRVLFSGSIGELCGAEIVSAAAVEAGYLEILRRARHHAEGVAG